MRRRLIKQGQGGLTMTLPISWVRKYNLTPGTEVELQDTEAGLLVSTEKGKTKREITIIVGKENKSRLRTIISSAYRRGYDVITLKSSEKLSLIKINEVVDSLIGFIITEQDEKKAILQNVMKDDFESVESVINKFFQTIKYLQSVVLELSKKNKGELKEILELKSSVLKLRDYCQRMINLNQYGQDRAFEYHALILLAEKYSANLVEVIQIKNNKTNKVNFEIKQIEEISSAYVNLYNSWLKKDLATALKLNGQVSILRKKLFVETKNNLTAVLVDNLFSFSSRMVAILI